MPGRHWYLAGIGVDPSAQRRGIGTALLQPGLDAAAARRTARGAAHEQRGQPPLLRAQRLRGRRGGRDARRMGRTPGLWSSGREPAPKRFPDRDEIARVRDEAEAVEPGEEGPEPRRLAGRVHGAPRHGEARLPRPGRPQRPDPAPLPGGAHRRDRRAPRRRRRRHRQADEVAARRAVADRRRARAALAQPLAAAGHVPRPHRHRAALPQALSRPADERGSARRFPAARAASSRRFAGTSTRRASSRSRRPILQPRYGGAFAEPFVTHHNVLDQDLYLRIATELYLKRLIVGGLEKVYEIGKDFRNEGVTYKNNPEFTMLEWYEAYADYQDTMRRMENLIEFVALEALGTTKVTFKGHELDVKAPWKRVRLVDELKELELWTPDYDDLKQRLEARDIDVSRDKTWSQLVDKAVTAYIEPRLIEPTILYDYPIELSPFARDDRRRPAGGRAVRVLRRRHGARERVLRAERRRGAGVAVRDAGGRRRRRQRRGRAGRPRLRRGALLRHAADRRDRPRHRPARRWCSPARTRSGT